MCEKCIKMSINKPRIGPVVLEIACNTLINKTIDIEVCSLHGGKTTSTSNKSSKTLLVSFLLEA